MKRRLVDLITDKSVQKFLAVGLLSFGVDYGLLLISLYVFHINLAIATTGAYLSGLALNFILNKLWTFEAPKGAKQSARQATQYALLVAVNLVTTNFIVETAQRAGVGPELSKPLATGFIMVLNYILYNRIIFRTTPP